MLIDRLLALGFTFSSRTAGYLDGDLFIQDRWGNRFLHTKDGWHSIRPATYNQSAGLNSPMTSEAFLAHLNTPEWG